jgi:putative SOS response-associated peptidase YedK
MCGRYVLKSTPQRLREVFGIEGPDTAHSEAWRPRYNLAPMQRAPIVRLLEGRRHLDLLQWGLIPSWAQDPALGNRLINARSETAAEKPAFRAAFKSRRCIVPADGFYEWQQQPSGKQPYYIHRQDGHLLAMAGLWEHWIPPGATEPLLTFTILTTGANRWMQRLHERMPVVLEGDDVGLWLDSGRKVEELQALMRPKEEEVGWEAYPVSRAVGNVRNDQEALLEPV